MNYALLRYRNYPLCNDGLNSVSQMKSGRRSQLCLEEMGNIIFQMGPIKLYNPL